MSYLEYLLESNKDAINAWVKAGADINDTRTAVAEFVQLKKENRIADVGDRDIAKWAKLPFKDFNSFIQKYLRHKTQIEVQLREDLVKKVFENEYCYVVVPRNYEGSRAYGSSGWCIVYGENYWNDYTMGQGLTPYFIILKDGIGENITDERNNREPLAKVAVMIDDHNDIDSIWSYYHNNKITEYTTFYETIDEINFDIDEEPRPIEITLEEFYKQIGLDINDVCYSSYTDFVGDDSEMDKDDVTHFITDEPGFDEWYATLEAFYKEQGKDKSDRDYIDKYDIINVLKKMFEDEDISNFKIDESEFLDALGDLIVRTLIFEEMQIFKDFLYLYSKDLSDLESSRTPTDEYDYNVY